MCMFFIVCVYIYVLSLEIQLSRGTDRCMISTKYGSVDISLYCFVPMEKSRCYLILI